MSVNASEDSWAESRSAVRRPSQIPGVIWAAVALVWMLLVGVGNGTVAMFATLGVWAYFVAVALGPILVGWLRRDRAAT